MANEKHGFKPVPPSEKRRKTSSHVEGLCSIVVKYYEQEAVYRIRLATAENNDGVHTHTLDQSDARKVVHAAKAIVDMHSSLGYKAAAIQSAIRSKPLEDGEDYVLRHVNSQFVRNSRIRTFLSQRKSISADKDDTIEVMSTVTWLQEKGYCFDAFADAEDNSVGFAFAHPNQLAILGKCGHVCLMDSTFNVCSLKWSLFTVYVRANGGTWIPGAHFFVERETITLISQGLSAVRRFFQSQPTKWRPRYFVIDQSQAEEGAISDCFQGTDVGEQQVDIVYCRVHVIRTLMRNLGKKQAAFKAMMEALRCYTRSMCEEAVKRAIHVSNDRKTESYIRNRWLKTTKRWGMFARQHSSLLLQMDTTNALEAYHRDLKMHVSQTNGMVAAVKSIHQLLERKLATEEREVLHMRTKQVAEVELYPELGKFSFQFQQMMVDELHHACRRSADCKPLREIDQAQPVCDCRFFRKYFLPCRHMFQLDIHAESGWLNDPIWNTFIDASGESGYDVYFGREREEVYDLEPQTTNQDTVRFHSKMELIRDKFWRLIEAEDRHGLDRLFEAICEVAAMTTSTAATTSSSSRATTATAAATSSSSRATTATAAATSSSSRATTATSTTSGRTNTNAPDMLTDDESDSDMEFEIARRMDQAIKEGKAVLACPPGSEVYFPGTVTGVQFERSGEVRHYSVECWSLSNDGTSWERAESHVPPTQVFENDFAEFYEVEIDEAIVQWDEDDDEYVDMQLKQSMDNLADVLGNILSGKDPSCWRYTSFFEGINMRNALFWKFKFNVFSKKESNYIMNLVGRTFLTKAYYKFIAHAPKTGEPLGEQAFISFLNTVMFPEACVHLTMQKLECTRDQVESMSVESESFLCVMDVLQSREIGSERMILRD